MKELIDYLNSISAEVTKESSELQTKDIPEVMQEFYKKIKKVDLFFGRIFDSELAIKNSSKEPFYPNWFVFGQDNYFNFWLCARNKSNDGCYFTYWDHESGLEIEEPTWDDLLSFLKEIEEENSDRW